MVTNYLHVHQLILILYKEFFQINQSIEEKKIIHENPNPSLNNDEKYKTIKRDYRVFMKKKFVKFSIIIIFLIWWWWIVFSSVVCFGNIFNIHYHHQHSMISLGNNKIFFWKRCTSWNIHNLNFEKRNEICLYSNFFFFFVLFNYHSFIISPCHHNHHHFLRRFWPVCEKRERERDNKMKPNQWKKTMKKNEFYLLLLLLIIKWLNYSFIHSFTTCFVFPQIFFLFEFVKYFPLFFYTRCWMQKTIKKKFFN